MKSSLLWVAVIGFSGFVLYSCSSPFGGPSGPNSMYTNKVLPASLVQKMPDSLAPGSSPSGSSGTAAYARSESGYSESEGGYFEIQEAVGEMAQMAQTIVVMGIVVDAIVSPSNPNPIEPGTTYASESITLTQSMINAINAQLEPDDQIPSSDAGTKITLNNLTYSTSGTGTFTNSISFTPPQFESETNTANAITYAWSADKTKLRVTWSGPATTMAYTYDISAKSSAFTFDNSATSLSFTLAVQDDPSSSNGGAYVYVKSGLGSAFSYTVWGYADNSGGLVESKITASGTTGYYEEGFGASGALLYAATSTDGTTFTVDPTYSNTQPVTAYGSDLGTASNSSKYSALNLQ